MSDPRVPVVVLGAGPAGLAAAWKLASRPTFRVTLIERGSAAGGNAGSFTLEGQRVDYGSHRLHPACPPRILDDIREMLGSDLLDRPRHGRIRLRGRWVHFPLKPVDLALRLPPSFLLGAAGDALRPGRRAGEDTFASALEARLGRTLCHDFYFPYVRKIWGVEPEALDAEQARRRVSVGSLAGLVKKVLRIAPGTAAKGFGRFYYPREGFGQIAEAYLRRVHEMGVEVCFETTLEQLQTDDGRVRSVAAVRRDGGRAVRPATLVVSTVPLPALVEALSPGAPGDVRASASALEYRAMILVYVVLEQPQFSEYDAHYLPEPHVPFTRVSEPKNYSLNGPAPRTVLCGELPCMVGDRHWQMSDDELGRWLVDSLGRLGLPVRSGLRLATTRRLSHAYPIYLRGYRPHLERLDRHMAGIDGLLSIGRQGLFAHDNTHHTLAMAYAANECADDTGRIDRERWAGHRRAFESHVVED